MRRSHFSDHVADTRRHGRSAEALEHGRLCQTDSPAPLGFGVIGACLARLNHRKEALEIVAKLFRLAEAEYVDPRAIAQVQIGLNDTKGVTASFRRMIDERSRGH